MEKQSFKYLDLITASLVAVLLISNISATKIIHIFGLTFDGGTFLFPMSYIFGDILTEVYGYKNSRRVIWTGFAWMLIAAATFQVAIMMPPAPDYTLQDAFAAILGQTPRILIASLCGYFAGEFSNSVVLAKMKILTDGKYLWMRTIGSTIVGEAVDTFVFVMIAFAGLEWASFDVLWSMFIFGYVFKVVVEALMTPVTYAIVDKLKQAERADIYDYNTDFNPFLVTDNYGGAINEQQA